MGEDVQNAGYVKDMTTMGENVQDAGCVKDMTTMGEDVQDAGSNGNSDMDMEMIRWLDSVHQLLCLRDSLSQVLRQMGRVTGMDGDGTGAVCHGACTDQPATL
jgi:predicted small secreted protein